MTNFYKKLSFGSYILLHTLSKMFSQNMPYIPNITEILSFLSFFGFSLIFCQIWLEWAPLWVFQRIRTDIYTSTYFAEKLLSKFARRFQI